MYVIVIRATRQPLGMVSATNDRELFEGMAALADEAGLQINELTSEDLSPRPYGTALHDAPAGESVKLLLA